MKTPEYRTFVVAGGGRGGGKTLADLVNAYKRIHQLESTYSQVSKALCGKENATPDELLQEVDQLKSRLAQVERERDAAVKVMRLVRMCGNCKHLDKPCESYPCSSCSMDRERSMPNWEWSGVCPENSKENAQDENH